VGGKSGGGGQVNRYYMSQHFGVCLGADRITRVTIKEKVAWEGSQSAMGTFTIDKRNLFGGLEKEGGVGGIVEYLPGAADQVLPDALAQKMGRANGADCPAYRGMLTMFFRGTTTPPALTGGHPGFYWSANNPYLPPVAVTVERAPVGLSPELAMIGRARESVEGQAVSLSWKQNTFVQVGGNDEARMGIGFLDDSGALIGSITWAAYSQPTVWTARNVAANAPAGATQVRLYMGMRRLAGTHCDGYIDSISVTVDGVPITIDNPGAEDGTSGWISTIGLIDYSNDTLGAVGTPAPDAGSFFFAGGNSAASQAHQTLVISDPGGDANPAHIIYECLINADWGMGSPTAAIDTTSFEEAAATLYAETFGLSLIWTQQDEIRNFVQEVLDHIQGVLFVDPATGLLTLKLIRGDYDEADLVTVSPDNADLANFNRKLWGDIVNEIVVTWTNPENEQDETVTVHDLASIATQGGIVSDGRNYHGVRNKELAQRLAQRDLRASGAPIAACDAEVDRTLWQIRPASVVKVTWPEHGLSELVMRVVDVDYGKPGDPIIKISMMEDVFGLDVGDYVAPPSTSFEDPAEDPEAATIQRAATLPYYFAVKSPAADYVDSPTYPEVVAGVLGTTTQDDAYLFELWAEVVQADASLEWEQIGSLNVTGHSTLSGSLAAESTSAGVTFATQIGDTVPTVAGFVLIGDDDEDGNEIAMITDDASGYDLQRGVLDTIPRAWPAGTPVWFVDAETLFEDSVVRSSGETAEYKLLTLTSQGVLDLGDATLLSHDLTDRPWQPNRPANVAVDGVLFNSLGTPVDKRTRPNPWVTVTWANRNRLLEDVLVLAWDDATMALETGQTTTITVYAQDLSTVLATHTGLSGTTYDVPDASFGVEPVAFIQVSSSRTDADGTFASLQAHGIWVQIDDYGPRVTEEGDPRVTEAADARVVEG
jgi:hypothetical protein